jgi:hypothetical protein
VHTRSELEELSNYLARAVPATTEELRLRFLDAQRPAPLGQPYKFLYTNW